MGTFRSDIFQTCMAKPLFMERFSEMECNGKFNINLFSGMFKIFLLSPIARFFFLSGAPAGPWNVHPTYEICWWAGVDGLTCIRPLGL